MKVARGTVVWVDIEPTRGHEQRGVRPCVVVSSADVAAQQRYPLVCVVPITGTLGEGALYPRLAPGPSGLRRPSVALVDQLRSVDKTRVRRVFGPLSPEEMQAIDMGLCLYLALDDTPLSAPA
jgi:mRNA interferase MazF